MRRFIGCRYRMLQLGLFLSMTALAFVAFWQFGGGKNSRVDAQESNRRGEQSSGETYAVLAYNDLGMHCMNPDFSEICILPPFNNLRAQVIKRDSSPDIVTGDVTVRFSIPGNTSSANKTDFWDFAPQLFGVALPDNIGLTGHGLRGKMTRVPRTRHYEASGIPITPLDDNFENDPFQLAEVVVRNEKGRKLAETVAVVPVSWEISCNFCHDTPGISVATDILRKHDRLHSEWHLIHLTAGEQMR